MFTNSLLRGMFSFECFLVRLYEQMNISFFCNKHKTLSRLELNFKRRIIVVEVRFENYTWIFPSFRWGIFDQVMRLDHSRTSKNIWWIIYWIVHSFWLVLMIKHTYVYTCRLDDDTINNILLSLSCNTVKRIPCCCAFVHYEITDDGVIMEVVKRGAVECVNNVLTTLKRLLWSYRRTAT